MGIYFHPELSHVTDRFLPSVLNCAVVGLCTVEKGFESVSSLKTRLAHTVVSFKSVESIPLLNGDDDSMPHRIIRSTNPPSDSQMPLLRCHGFGLIRSIDIEKKVFHVITPVEVQNLQKVKILALGYSLQTPEILFDRNVRSLLMRYLQIIYLVNPSSSIHC
jgi:hypothetical protein